MVPLPSCMIGWQRVKGKQVQSLCELVTVCAECHANGRLEGRCVKVTGIYSLFREGRARHADARARKPAICLVQEMISGSRVIDRTVQTGPTACLALAHRTHSGISGWVFYL